MSSTKRKNIVKVRDISDSTCLFEPVYHVTGPINEEGTLSSS